MPCYADDFVITARSKELVEQAQETVRNHIAERGLQLSEEKTVVTNIAGGFDFLGWNFRKYRGKLFIKPSKKAQQIIRGKIRDMIRSNIGTPQDDLIKLLNSILRG
jgi:RNA-directed DNA polymerase